MRKGLKSMTEDVIKDPAILIRLQNVVARGTTQDTFESMTLMEMLDFYNSNQQFAYRKKGNK